MRAVEVEQESLEGRLLAVLSGHGVRPRWGGSAEPDPTERLHRRLRLAAAVLAEFDPHKLRPAPEPGAGAEWGEEERARDALRQDADPVRVGPHGRVRLTLREPIRQDALRDLGPRWMLRAALDWNSPRPNSPLQTMVERLVNDEAIRVEKLSRDEAAGLLAAIRWFDGLLPDLPDRVAVERALARRDLVERIEALAAGDVFVGREEEEAELAALFRGDGAGRRGPILLHGPGGVGKSTLAARAVRPAVVKGVPVLWLDFDRTLLDPARPFSIVAEMVRQLAALRPEHERALHDLQELIRRWASEATDESGGHAKVRSILFLTQQAGGPLRSVLGNDPLILVIDTFEEVQLQGPDAEETVFAILEGLGAALPQLAALLCGRGGPRDDRARAIPLGELPPAKAEEALRRMVDDDWQPSLATIAAELGGNPLVLRLAARVIEEEGADKLTTPEGMAELRAAIREQRLQVVLYGRILSHLKTDAARRIAFPGLVVRVITPEVIRAVLAKPCGVDLSEPGAAEAAQAALAQEKGLVVPDPPTGGVRHRPEVRRLMLGTLLSFVDAETVAAIDSAAVTHWAGLSGPAARAEELYHRLRRGEPRAELEARWDPAAGPLLNDALEELEPVQRLWLAERLGATVDAALRAEADRADWSAQARLAAERRLRAGNAAGALAVLRERPQTPASGALALLEVGALRALDRAPEASALARGLAPELLAAGDITSAADLWLEASHIAEAAGEMEEALALAGRACDAVAAMTDGLLPLRALLTRARTLRKLGPDGDPERRLVLETLQRRATPERLRSLADRPTLLREYVAELGTIDADILRMGVAQVGLEARSEAEREELTAAVKEVGAARSRQLGTEDLAPSYDAAESVSGLEAMLGQGAGSAAGEIGSVVAEALAQAPADAGLRAAVTRYFRAAVDTNTSRNWDDPFKF